MFLINSQEERGKNPKLPMHTLLCLKWITSEDLTYSTWNSAQCYAAAWMGGEFLGEWIHYVWLSLFTVHLKLSQYCMLISHAVMCCAKLL